MDDESSVLVFADHLIQKAVAGIAFLIEHASLAKASVDKEPKRQGKIGLTTEIVYRLRPAIFGEAEIILVEVIDDLPVLISDRCDDIDHFDLDGESSSWAGGILG